MKQDHTTTIRLPKELHRAARKKAIDKGLPLSEVIRQLLREWLEQQEENDDDAIKRS